MENKNELTEIIIAVMGIIIIIFIIMLSISNDILNNYKEELNCYKNLDKENCEILYK